MATDVIPVTFLSDDEHPSQGKLSDPEANAPDLNAYTVTGNKIYANHTVSLPGW